MSNFFPNLSDFVKLSSARGYRKAKPQCQPVEICILHAILGLLNIMPLVKLSI